jgi:hypothetical protein
MKSDTGEFYQKYVAALKLSLKSDKQQYRKLYINSLNTYRNEEYFGKKCRYNLNAHSGSDAAPSGLRDKQEA